MAHNPWGESSQIKGPSLQSIINEEGIEKDERIAHELHQKLNMASVQSEIVKEVDSDELLARKLQEELNRDDNADTENDAFLAAMMQQQIDTENIAKEDQRNGNCKLTVSAYSGVSKPTVLEELSHDTENSFFEFAELPPDSSRTKHDTEMTSVKNQKKISDTFNIEFNTGDFSNITVPHKVFNELQVEAHKSKFNGIRVKDRRDLSTHEKVLDKKTRVVLLKMLNSGIVKQINGVVSGGKESVIIHCNGGSILNPCYTPVPHECVFKIHKTSLNEFSRRRDYLDSRYKNVINQKTKKLIEVWAMKEAHNLRRLRRAGIMCPEVVVHRKQLLLLSFVGCNGVPALTLKEVVFSSEQLKSAYQQLLAGMKTMFSKCKLVHADLSGYNLLWYNGVLYFIDLSQAVLTDHPSALTYLYRDCTNMYNYFHSRSLKNLLDPKKMLCHVSDLDIKYSATDEASFTTQIEHLQRQEVHDFKHGSTATDYAFETSFNESLANAISSESEEDEESEGEEEELETVEETS